MKMEHLQNIQSLETSIETGNLQSYDEQCILFILLILVVVELRLCMIVTLSWNAITRFLE